jgi:hypothetical protein
MNESEARSLSMEYQDPSTSQDRKDDILFFFFVSFKPYIIKWAWAGDDGIQESYCGIHDVISKWKDQGNNDIVKILFYTIKTRSLKEYASQYKKHAKNRIGGDISSVEIKMTGQRYTNPYYKFHQRTMDRFNTSDNSDNIYDKELPAMSDMLKSYFMEDLSIPDMMKKYKLVNIDKIRKMVLAELNSIRISNDLEPFDSLVQAKASPLQEKVKVRMWFEKNRERQREYYRKAKAKGKYKIYANNAKKKAKQALNGYQ